MVTSGDLDLSAFSTVQTFAYQNWWIGAKSSTPFKPKCL